MKTGSDNSKRVYTPLLGEADVLSTVLTGLAARDNQSATVQIFSRMCQTSRLVCDVKRLARIFLGKDFRTWRYKTDIYVDGVRIYFDM